MPQVFIPQLIDLHLQGRFPYDRLLKFYDFENINQAIADSEAGTAIKPVAHAQVVAAHPHQTHKGDRMTSNSQTTDFPRQPSRRDLLGIAGAAGLRSLRHSQRERRPATMRCALAL